MGYKFAEAFASDQKYIIYLLFPLIVNHELEGQFSAPPLCNKGGARAAALTAMSEATKMVLVLVLAAIVCE